MKFLLQENKQDKKIHIYIYIKDTTIQGDLGVSEFNISVCSPTLISPPNTLWSLLLH